MVVHIAQLHCHLGFVLAMYDHQPMYGHATTTYLN